MIKKVFPSNVELNRIKTLRKYELIHDNDQASVLLLHNIIKKQFKDVNDIPYLAHAVPSKVSEFYQDFVQGNVEDLSITVLNGGESEENFLKEVIDDNDLKESFADFAYNQSEYGFEVLLGYVKDNKFKIQIVPKDQYFPQADGSVIFATYLYDPNDTNTLAKDKVKILYTQQYKVSENKTNVEIERKLWTVDEFGRAKEELLLSYAGIESKELEIIENLDYLPIVQIDNGRQTKWGFGKSDYADIMPQLAEINERRTHISVQLLKNMDSLLQLPKIESLVGGDGKLTSFDFIMPSKDDADAKYITNDNPLIDATEKHIESQFKTISWVTCVPMFELLKSGMPERVESLRIQLFSAERKTTTKRTQITKGIRNILYIGYKMVNGKDMTGEIKIKYGDVLPTDKTADTQIESDMVVNGLSSKESSIMRLHNYTQEEAKIEMDKIRNENIESGALNPNNPPTI